MRDEGARFWGLLHLHARRSCIIAASRCVPPISFPPRSPSRAAESSLFFPVTLAAAFYMPFGGSYSKRCHAIF